MGRTETYLVQPPCWRVLAPVRPGNSNRKDLSLPRDSSSRAATGDIAGTPRTPQETRPHAWPASWKSGRASTNKWAIRTGGNQRLASLSLTFDLPLAPILVGLKCTHRASCQHSRACLPGRMQPTHCARRSSDLTRSCQVRAFFSNDPLAALLFAGDCLDLGHASVASWG